MFGVRNLYAKHPHLLLLKGYTWAILTLILGDFMTLDLSLIRSQFPALAGDAVFLDNPAGTQVAAQVLKRINQYLVEMNANAHGAFSTSIASDILLDETRAACADFYNASRPEEIVFGPNMTSLTFNFSRSLARQLDPGDEIVVTRLDHDANITPWTMVAEDRGCTIRWVDFDVENGTRASIALKLHWHINPSWWRWATLRTPWGRSIQ